MLNIFRKDPAKKYDLLYTTVAKTGIVVLSGGERPDLFRWKTIITEGSDTLSELDDQAWREQMRLRLPAIIHNSLYAQSFPGDADLNAILGNAEHLLQDNAEIPWVGMNYDAGNLGLVIDVDTLIQHVDEITTMALGSSRSRFESIMQSISDNIINSVSYTHLTLPTKRIV